MNNFQQIANLVININYIVSIELINEKLIIQTTTGSRHTIIKTQDYQSYQEIIDWFLNYKEKE